MQISRCSCSSHAWSLNNACVAQEHHQSIVPPPPAAGVENGETSHLIVVKHMHRHDRPASQHEADASTSGSHQPGTQVRSPLSPCTLSQCCIKLIPCNDMFICRGCCNISYAAAHCLSICLRWLGSMQGGASSSEGDMEVCFYPSRIRSVAGISSAAFQCMAMQTSERHSPEHSFSSLIVLPCTQAPHQAQRPSTTPTAELAT